MSFNSTFTAVLTASILMTTTAFAEGLMVKDPYARSARPNAPTGAAFMMLLNHTDQDLKLIGVRSDVAKRVELHTHIDKGDGIMQMRQIEGGIAIPAGESHMMKRGGDHVMLMGLNQSLVDGETIAVIFEFENAKDMTVEIPIDSKRKPSNDVGH
ncbi:MAG: copper(I)-binding protein [Candidatus Azotimanducaceae bacterium]|jgi:copper(I)-binding protein